MAVYPSSSPDRRPGLGLPMTELAASSCHAAPVRCNNRSSQCDRLFPKTKEHTYPPWATRNTCMLAVRCMLERGDTIQFACCFNHCSSRPRKHSKVHRLRLASLCNSIWKTKVSCEECALLANESLRVQVQLQNESLHVHTDQSMRVAKAE